jgi:hypothetical protein
MTRRFRGWTSDDGSVGRHVLLLALAGLVAALAYALIYPWRGFTVPIGLDTPVYLWSAQHAAAFGLDAGGLLGRLGAFGAVATLLEVLPVGDLTVIAAAQVALIVVAALAAAAFTATTFGAHVVLMTGITVLVALFLTPLAYGYLSASMFLASFTAGLAVLVRSAQETWRSVVLAGALFTAGALSHPLFVTIGLPVVMGVIGVLALRRRTLASWRPAVGRVAVALAFAVGATLLILFAVTPDLPPLDTSADAALRRLGADSNTVISRRQALKVVLPQFLFLLLAGLLVLDRFLRKPDPSADAATRGTVFWSACAGWVVVSGAGILALAAGLPVPAHRLLAVCLPPTLVVGVAMTRLFRSDRSPLVGRWAGVARVAAPIAVLMVFGSVHALQWREAEPTITAPEARFLARLGSGLERSPEATGAILLAGDTAPLTEMIDELNWMRSWIAPNRLNDVSVFPGGPGSLYGDGPEPLGARFHDPVVADYVAHVRSVLDAGSVVAAAAPIDPSAMAEARDVNGARSFGDDAVLLPARSGQRAVVVTRPDEVRLLSPWTVPLWAPALVVGLALVGIGWVRWSMPKRPLLERVALSPAVGLAALSLASALVDIAGLRLGSGGSLVAALIGLVPGALLGARAAVPERWSCGTEANDDPIVGRSDGG